MDTDTLNALTAALTALSGLLGMGVALIPLIRGWDVQTKVKSLGQRQDRLPPGLPNPGSPVALEPPG